ncbi:spore germination protein [Paenibacillus sp. MWE-103]|uniref:Spore germination protein n=1 Tax=Paenibacillus artemisiicola TaxID=1172618 RepID=A0ABS3WEW9_9BACL|nr:spore germination protein [Paenibacillus artemisiicola]MBO7746651.1 spore germination protein [Paenibacillus artemisiicola]
MMEQQQQEQQEQQQQDRPQLSHIAQQFDDCADFKHQTYAQLNVDLLYFDHMIDGQKLDREILGPLQSAPEDKLQDMLDRLSFARKSEDKQIVEDILSGSVALFHRDAVYSIDLYSPKGRPISQSETETTITGPHEAFSEPAGETLSLIRRRVRSSHLKCLRFRVGEITKTDVYLLYVADIANMDNVDELKRRIQGVEIDAVHDTNMLVQLIDDRPASLFPQFFTTERPDAIASKLVAGRIVGIMDGSPYAFSAPTSFFEFFTSSDDYYQRWSLGTATRILRFISFIITILFTCFYVSVTTFHYEMIPQNMLLTLSESRSRVPFPPVYEALFMEAVIEFLREAGARLPTKIGQTIGIVGGIVIGQAAVQAGFTSNILIIVVASSAIASFVMPSYIMSASIRLIRFGLIILAGIWGNLGITIGIAYLIIHLSHLTSLNSSYMTPIAPHKPGDWLDVFIRAPFKLLKKRPTQARTPNPVHVRTKK